MTSGAGDSDNSTGQVPRRALQPDPDVVSRRIDAGTVLINLRTNKIYELNATGSRIWELLMDGRTVVEMQAALEQEFEVEASEAGRAIEETLGRLEEEGLVTSRD